MVVVLSPDANESEWVNREILVAQQRKLRIFPVLAQGSAEDAVPLALVDVQYVDVRADWNSVQGRLLPALRRHLGMTAIGTEEAAQVKPAPAPPAPEPDIAAQLGIEWIYDSGGRIHHGQHGTAN